MVGRDLVRIAGGVAEDDDPAERRERAAARRSKPRRRSCASTASTCSPPFASRIASCRSSARESTVASAPRRAASARFSSLEASAITRAPARLASWTARRPGAAGRPPRRRPSPPPGCWAQKLTQRVRGEALEQKRRGLLVADLVRKRHQPGLGHGDLLGVAAVGEQRRDPASVRRRAADLAARGQRQALLGEVVVADRVGVREVDSGSGRRRPRPAVSRLRVGELDVLHVLGPAELLDLNSLHRLIAALHISACR